MPTHTELAKRRGQKGGSAPKHRWTEGEREFVRVRYAHSHESRRQIAHQLGVTEFAVAGQIAQMGIAKRTDRRSWTAQEDDRLQHLMERYSAKQVAKRMKRSVNSVVVRSKRLGISRRNRYGWYTKREVCEILGVDHKWVQKRIDSGALKATYHNGHRPHKNGLHMWHIAERDLKSYLQRYPHELNGRNVDLVQLVDILAGVKAM